MLYSRLRCAKVGYSYYLWFLAVNETLVDRNRGMRCGVFVVCSLMNFDVFLPNCTTEIDQTIHPISYRPNTASNFRS